MQPFRNVGMTTLAIRNTGGTDHLSFDAVGLPGFQFIQDPVEYERAPTTSNMDVYERIQPNDMMHNAVIVASFVYTRRTRITCCRASRCRSRRRARRASSSGRGGKGRRGRTGGKGWQGGAGLAMSARLPGGFSLGSQPKGRGFKSRPATS